MSLAIWRATLRKTSSSESTHLYYNGSTTVKSLTMLTMRLEVRPNEPRKTRYKWIRMRTAKVIRDAKTGNLLYKYSINHALGLQVGDIPEWPEQ